MWKGPDYTMIVRNAVLAVLHSALLLYPAAALAQRALPTATQTLQLSGFGGVGGVFTGLADGRNVDVVAGADLGLPPVHGVRPEIEIRGAYPMYRGDVDWEKSILGGVKTDFLLNHRLRPYGDFLFGRGEVRYAEGGYQVGNLIYLVSTTNVYSFGGGMEQDLTDRFAIRVDGQIQKWGYAPTPSGNMYPKLLTVALVYRLRFHHPNR